MVVPLLSRTILICIPRVTQLPGFFFTHITHSGVMVAKGRLPLGASTKPGVATVILHPWNPRHPCVCTCLDASHALFSHVELTDHLSPVASMMNVSRFWDELWSCSKEQDPAKNKDCQLCSLGFPGYYGQQCMNWNMDFKDNNASPERQTLSQL